tara:strand:- start:3723 stop:4781 length:1059 start_codon:yes stop_codon:yes gene_type:complete
MKLSFKKPEVVSENKPIDYITKETILSHCSQEELFERYSGEQISNEMFCSKLRVDNKPGCKFTYSKSNILYHVDYARGQYLDVFDYVSLLFNISFIEALRQIGHDYAIINNNNIERIPVIPEKCDEVKKASKDKAKIVFSNRDWSNVDAEYWGRYKIPSKLLNKFNVVPVQYAWINDVLWYSNNTKDPCYAYGFRNNQEIKLYRPMGLKYTKWRNNSDSVQGFEQLDFKSDYIVITKSLKDVIVLNMMGVESVAVQGEGQVISKGTMDILKEKYSKIYVLFDNDKAGKIGMVKHRQEYDFVECIMFPLSLCKDASDIIEKATDEKILSVKKAIKQKGNFKEIIKILSYVKKK